MNGADWPTGMLKSDRQCHLSLIISTENENTFLILFLFPL